MSNNVCRKNIYNDIILSYYTSRKCGSSVGSSDAQKLDVTVMIAPTTKAEGIINNFIIPLERLPTACDAFTSSICKLSYKKKVFI